MPDCTTPRRALAARRTLAPGDAVAAAPTVAIAPTSSTAPGVIAVAGLAGDDQRVVADARHGPVSMTRLRAPPVRAPAAVDPTTSAATPLPRPGSHRPMPRDRPTVRVRVDEPDVAIRPRAGPRTARSRRARFRRARTGGRVVNRGGLGGATGAECDLAGRRDESIRTTAATPPTVTAAVASTDAVANPFETIATPAALPAVLAAAAPPVAAPLVPSAPPPAPPPMAESIARASTTADAAAGRTGTIARISTWRDPSRPRTPSTTRSRTGARAHAYRAGPGGRRRRPLGTSAHAITRPSAHSAIPAGLRRSSVWPLRGRSRARPRFLVRQPAQLPHHDALRARSGSDARSRGASPDVPARRPVLGRGRHREPASASGCSSRRRRRRPRSPRCARSGTARGVAARCAGRVQRRQRARELDWSASCASASS